MDSKIVFVALVLIASFALPSLAALERDFISADVVTALLKEGNSDAINAFTSKTLVSSAVFEEALLKNLNHGGVNGLTGNHCQESCMVLPCFTASLYGCSCSGAICWKNSIDMQ